MKGLDELTLKAMEDLLAASRNQWTTEDSDTSFGFIAAVPEQQSYGKLGKRERGVVKRFLTKVAAISRAQLTRVHNGSTQTVKRKPARSRTLLAITGTKISSVAATHAAHEDLSGPRATVHSCSANTKPSTNRNSNGCRRSRYRTFTTCGHEPM